MKLFFRSLLLFFLLSSRSLLAFYSFDDSFLPSDLNQDIHKILYREFHRESLPHAIDAISITICRVNADTITTLFSSSIQADSTARDYAKQSRPCASLIKPLIYALHQMDNPNDESLVMNEPCDIFGYHAHNVGRNFPDSVPVDYALKHSLNVPFVYLLSELGVYRFSDMLEELSFPIRLNDRHPLSLACEGSNNTSLELARLYGHLLQDYYFEKEDIVFSKNSVSKLFQTMKEIPLPSYSERFIYEQEPIPWKSALSFGWTDAWAVGIEAEYVVVVRLGSMQALSIKGLSGRLHATPLLFEVISYLRAL